MIFLSVSTIFWLFFSIVAGVIANHKGRSGFGFFLLSILLSPLIGVIAALFARPNVIKIEEGKIASGPNGRCPFCAEVIKKDASVCRHCGKGLNSNPPDLDFYAVQAQRETVESCTSRLASLGHKVVYRGNSKWEITHPNSAGVSFVYSVDDLVQCTTMIVNEQKNPA